MVVRSIITPWGQAKLQQATTEESLFRICSLADLHRPPPKPRAFPCYHFHPAQRVRKLLRHDRNSDVISVSKSCSTLQRAAMWRLTSTKLEGPIDHREA
jgi:hypothetical protein